MPRMRKDTPRITPAASAHRQAAGGTIPGVGHNKRRRPVRSHQMFKEHYARLKAPSLALPPPPPVYEPNTQYHVQLSHSVQLPDHGVWLRPSHDVIISGAVAQSIASVIIGAEAIPEVPHAPIQ